MTDKKTSKSAAVARAQEILDALGLRDQELTSLEVALGAKQDESDFTSRLETLADLALREYVEWLVGRRRFNSIPESDGHRVRAIFLELRREPPTVEQLVDGFGLSESRATSLLSRMRYGEARRLRILGYGAAARTLEGQVSAASEDTDGRKTLYLTRDVWDVANEAAWHVMSQPAEHAKGGAYEGAEWPEARVDRWGAAVRAPTSMWGYITAWLKAAAGAPD